jgi:acyl-CoA reductase-like NAD-dependent aldehyde dehydrogenase
MNAEVAQSHVAAAAVASGLRARPVKHLVNGVLRTSVVEVDVVNPASAEAVASAPCANRALLDEAVHAARAAQPSWQRYRVEERRRLLLEVAALLRQNCEELASLITLEQGKPLPKAMDEVRRSAAMLEEIVSISIEPEVLRENEAGRAELHYRPLGVVGAIAPWNVPIGLAVPKIVHALYTGNTAILKPSPYTPLATLRLGEILKDVFPAGVLNIISGDDDLGQWISEHRGIDKISFTGSIATGRKVMSSSSTNLKSLTLELGGNDPAIVLDDVDVGQVAPKLLAAAFINSGQVCMAIKRLYVHENVYRPLLDQLVALTKSSVTGNGFRAGVDYGPLQNRAQLDRARQIAEEARARQAKMWSAPACRETGYFMEPTIVADIDDEARLVTEEQFAPILPVLPFRNTDEALTRANAGDFGLASSVWTSNPDRAREIAQCISAGTVWINRHVGADPHVPFGGLKQSGLGAQFGRSGLLGYMERSAVFVPHS